MHHSNHNIWRIDVWGFLLQCKLVGNAQEVCASLTTDQGLYYDIKATILPAYKLVHEAYHWKFHACEKSANQTPVEFTRE